MKLTERQKFDRWCKRNHYYREGKRVMAGPSWDRYVSTSYPPSDVDIAWEAWQEALRTCGVPAAPAPSDEEWAEEMLRLARWWDHMRLSGQPSSAELASMRRHASGVGGTDDR